MVKPNEPNKFQKNFHESLNSPAFSQESFKGILALSDQLRLYTEQNRSIFDQAIKASALSSSVIENMRRFSLPENSQILANLSKLNALEKIKQSPTFDQVNAANLSISKLLKAVDSSNISKLMQQGTLQSAAWQKQFKAIDTIPGSLHRYDLVLQSHLADISKFSALSQISLSHLPLEGFLGNALRIETSIQGVLQNTFIDLGKSYSKLFASLSHNPASLISLPPIVSLYSAVEFLNGVRLAEAVTIQSDELEFELQFEEETHQLEKDVQQETESVLEELLGKLNVELIRLLHGARQSLESTNPDKARQAATSLRELFTHVLHTLSPDDQVKNWSNSPEHYDKGKLTRRARLLYICRSLNHGPCSDFIEKDINAVLEFLKLFQRGTHEITSPYTELQLKMMLRRMESTLRFLLEIWMESNIL
ncbi:pPIWI-associating nuclease domain-containing protein [Microcoleus sp. S13C4]|uniref:pPIWI-associating nuclease domain-containing protein n=1 Tax=Microcoleus sp. S13C4 TaxID=3055410 RepID=UPI002FD44BAC